MRIKKRPLRLELDDAEIAMLQSLLDELTTVVRAEDADDPVHQRLFPAAYADDGDAEAEYREITESGLRDDRVERIETTADQLAAASTVPLDDDETVRRWIQVLNDLRLALGTRLGVTEDPPDFDPTDPEAQRWLIYHWLTHLQESVVTAVMP